MITEKIEQGAQIDGKNMDYAFDLNEFFATKDNGDLVYKKQVLKWLDTLAKNEKYPFSTPELRTELKHTFWILDRVASAKALMKLLKKHEVFKDYKIVLAAGDGKVTDDQKINESSLTRVKEAIRKNDKTITLSVGQLTTGITVPEWTAVLMLSNMRSPSLYMQAAFRAQNAWRYEENGLSKRKENAYVFDFSPERTLMIYDEFANNLSNKSSEILDVDKRQRKIRQLLNFFPVIAEDSTGKMTELDAKQVLTMPKVLKAKEVVKRGFMSNFLFKNISGIFSSPEAKEILEDLNPLPKNKNVPQNNRVKVDTKEIELDENGAVKIRPEIVIGENKAHFGEKVYKEMEEEIENSESAKLQMLASQIFKKRTLEATKALAKEKGLTTKQAERITNLGAKAVAREVEEIQIKNNIRKNKVKKEFELRKAEAQLDSKALQKIEEQLQQKIQKVES
ncbi:hypothetical protein, partial [Helicobacter rodentium]|uniref:hypothetical protein n=1 Tax=Helicobacter rodentium TaxID=59617 RepID=UPI0026047A80